MNPGHATQWDATYRSATRWSTHHPIERAVLCGGLLLVALLRTELVASFVVLGATTMCAVRAGISVRRWVTLLMLPLGFVALSVLPFAVTTTGAGTGATEAWHWSTNGAQQGLSLGLHALACAGGLLLFAATTPLHHVMLLLRRAGVPVLLTDAALLSARLMVIVHTRFTARGHAATLRLGDVTWRARWRTAANRGAGLLLDTVHRAERLERGVAVRGGFSTEQVVTSAWRPVSGVHLVWGAGVVVTVVLLVEWVVRYVER